MPRPTPRSAPLCADTLHSATVLLISHRVTTLMQADRILVLDGGRVAELGTHAGADRTARHLPGYL